MIEHFRVGDFVASIEWVSRMTNCGPVESYVARIASPEGRIYYRSYGNGVSAKGWIDEMFKYPELLILRDEMSYALDPDHIRSAISRDFG